MGLKQLNAKDRISFLRGFTRELIYNYVQEEYRVRQIEVEKIRQKFIQPSISPEDAIGRVVKSPVFQPSQFVVRPMPISPLVSVVPAKVITPTKAVMARPFQPPRVVVRPSKPLYPKESSMLNYSQNNNLNKIQPEYQPKPGGFYLGKIDALLRDSTIQSIECQGPGKNLLVRRRGKISSTKIALTPDEINSIVNDFSVQAKIPLVGGILKAAVGDLIISAVTSEFVGSRFIISRLSPSFGALGK